MSLDLTIKNAAAYLEARGIGLAPPCIIELGGGVSNTVLLVELDSTRMVLKQALGKLRVEQEWLADRARIFREAAALQRLAPLLPQGSLPAVIFEDRDNFTFAMSAAPAGSTTWKERLLQGEIRAGTARQVGELLSSIARVSWRDPSWEAEFGDQTVFDQLRIDPYYRAAALRHPDLAPAAQRLIEQSALRRVSLTHGDWSPKNFLVHGDDVMAIDFEVIHFGDPAFDTAFLLNHLLLKSFHRPQWASSYAEAAAAFWRAYLAGVPPEPWIAPATIEHLGWLLLARVDGKSPAEYLRDPATHDRVRQFARELIVSPPNSPLEVFEGL
jgi:aminoglycoside phosphotransferase (APT) family kinase protein